MILINIGKCSNKILPPIALFHQTVSISLMDCLPPVIRRCNKHTSYYCLNSIFTYRFDPHLLFYFFYPFFQLINFFIQLFQKKPIKMIFTIKSFKISSSSGFPVLLITTLHIVPVPEYLYNSMGALNFFYYIPMHGTKKAPAIDYPDNINSRYPSFFKASFNSSLVNLELPITESNFLYTSHIARSSNLISFFL